MSNSAKQGIVIAIANQKGGVSKTTLSANLLVLLTELGLNVLGVDMDPQGHLTYTFGRDPDVIEATVYDVLSEHQVEEEDEQTGAITERPIRLEDVIIPSYYDPESKAFFDPDEEVEEDGKRQTLGAYFAGKHRAGPDIAPINISASKIDSELPSRDPSWGNLLSQALENARTVYDYVIIDCNPSLGVLTINALYAADYVLIPAQPEMLSLRGLKDLLDSIEKAHKRNRKLQVLGVVHTKVQPYKMHKQVTETVDMILQERGLYKFITEIKQNVMHVNASYARSVGVLASPKSEQATSHWSVLAEMLQRIGGVGLAHKKIQDALEKINAKKQEKEKQTSEAL